MNEIVQEAHLVANVEAGFDSEPANVEGCVERGLMYASGRDVAFDLVSAHKWFNIAATRGCVDAIRLRREMAEQMSDVEIGCAQRAARDWLRMHPLPTARPASDLQVAA
jgi:TPR repeat protein